MVVKTRSKDGRITGVWVGAENARLFPQKHPQIDLQLGHVHIQCKLPRDFWQNRPEIQDTRLADWLESMHLRPASGGCEIALEMTKHNDNSFQLHPAAKKPCPKVRIHCPSDSCETCPIDTLWLE